MESSSSQADGYGLTLMNLQLLLQSVFLKTDAAFTYLYIYKQSLKQ